MLANNHVCIACAAAYRESWKAALKDGITFAANVIRDTLPDKDKSQSDRALNDDAPLSTGKLAQLLAVSAGGCILVLNITFNSSMPTCCVAVGAHEYPQQRRADVTLHCPAALMLP